MDAQGSMYINKTMYPENEFGPKLREAMTGRASKVVFFAADGELLFDKVAHFMDLCRNNGADNLGIVFDDLRPGAATASAPAGAP
jgi:biopolymer transport protein ExbD